MYDAAEREMDLYRAEITRITAERDEARAVVGRLRGLFGAPDEYGVCRASTTASSLARWGAGTQDPAAELAALRELLDRFTSAVINVSGRPTLTAMARNVRKRAGLPS